MRAFVFVILSMLGSMTFANNLSMEEHRDTFYKYACNNTQYFQVEDFYHDDIYKKIIVGLP